MTRRLGRARKGDFDFVFRQQRYLHIVCAKARMEDDIPPRKRPRAGPSPLAAKAQASLRELMQTTTPDETPPTEKDPDPESPDTMRRILIHWRRPSV